MNPEFTTDKTALRRHFAALRDNLSPLERTHAECVMRKALFSLDAWKKAPLVCGYTSIRSEPDMTPIWEQAVSEGKPYALPVTLTGASEGHMIFRRLSGFTPHELSAARFGILEPTDTCPPLSVQDFEGALILVPGLAFDDGGFRIGYGGGYYDRFLSNLQQAGVPVTTVGLAFAVCRAATLPHHPHDIPVDVIIDERRSLTVHGI